MTEREVIEVAAELLAMVNDSRGAGRSLAEARIERLERAVIAAAVRGQLGPWDREIVDVHAIDPVRALVWLAAVRALDGLGGDLRRARVDGRGVVVGGRRPRPWDVVRLLLATMPRSLDVDAFAALQLQLQEEVDAIATAPAVVGALQLLLAERRRVAALDRLLPVLAALDAGDPLPDTAALLEQAADAFRGARDTLSQVAA